MSISLINLFLANLGLFALFKYVLHPFTAKIAAKDKSRSAFKKIVVRNITDFGSLFFLLVTISSGICWIVVKVINTRGGTTVEDVKASLELVRELDSITSAIGADWAFITTVLITVALIILAFRSTKKSFNERLEHAISEDLLRLQREHESGEWKELPPTEEMEKVEKLIQEYSGQIQALNEKAETEGAAEALKLLLEQHDTLISYYQNLDIQRRLNIEIDEEAYPEPTTLKERVLLFFVSQGLMNTFKRGGSILFVLGILLLIPSLLSVGSKIISVDADTKIASLNSNLETLELDIQAREIEDEFNKIVIVTDDKADEPLSDEDEMVLDELSKVFENSIVETRVIGRTLPVMARASGVTNYSVRSSILNNFSTSDGKVKVSKPGDVPGIINDAAELEKKAISNNKPATKLGKRIKSDLRLVAVNNKSVWSHYKKITLNATKSFQVPASARSIKGMMISNVIGHIAQGIEVPGMTGKIAGNLANIPSGVAEQFYINESKRFMVELAKAENLGNVVGEIDKTRYRSLPSQHLQGLNELSNKIPAEGKLAKVVNTNPPSLSRSVESHVQLNKAQNTIKNIAKVSGTQGSRTFADALSSYGDYFPGYEGEDRRTSKGKTLSNSSRSSGSKGHYSPKKATVRSRSYVKLRGFARIGGVLIGRMPSDNKTIDVRDINWKRDGNKTSISLALADGKQIEIGKFNPAIAHLALGYAADGRVTTVTMVSSDPLYDLRILLHPVLVDTSLGCRAIRLDQVADETSSKNSELKKLRASEAQKIQNSKILYGYAWASRLLKIARDNQYIASEIKDYIQFAKRTLRNSKDKIAPMLKERAYELRFVSAYPGFYDKKLIGIIKQCKGSKNFIQCVERNTPVNASVQNPTWLILPPETVDWSGVRELEYTLDKEFDFLALDAHSGLWPFRFIVQTVFSSPPELASSNNIDPEPWEHESVNKQLEEKINYYLSRDPELKSVFEDMREFAVLQRLFKLALSNKFGDRFPIEKLVLLANETKKDLSEYNRTLRWLPKPGALEKLAMMQAVQTGSTITAYEELDLKLQLRKELGIFKDEEQITNTTGKECPEA